MSDKNTDPRGGLIGALDLQIERLAKWVETHAPYCATEQSHTIEASRERGYWHHGYLAALRDMRLQLRTTLGND
jgi:hypothetical protein